MRDRFILPVIGGLMASLLLAAPAAADTPWLRVELEMGAQPVTATLTRAGLTAEAGYTIEVRNTGIRSLRRGILVVDQATLPKQSVNAPFQRIVTSAPIECRPGSETSWTEAAIVCRLPRLRRDASWSATVSFRTPQSEPALVGLPLSVRTSVWQWRPGHAPEEPVADLRGGPPGHLRELASASAAATLVEQVRETFVSYVPPEGATVTTQPKSPLQDVNLLGRNNPLAVVVTVPPSDAGIPVSIQERVEVAPREVCPGWARFCIGQVLEFDVPGEFSSENPLEVFLRWNATELPKGKKLKNFKVRWIHDDGSKEIIFRRCDETFSYLPCRTELVRFVDGDWGLTIYLPHNGRVRGL